MVCLDTIKSLLDDNRDVLEEIIPDSEQYYAEKRAAILNEYKYRGIGSCDVDYWIDCMQARYFSIVSKYDIAFERWLAFANKQDKTFADGSSVVTTEVEYGHVIETQHGHVLTTAHGEVITTSHGKTVTTEREDNPDNPAGQTKYLSNRDTQTDSGTDSDTHSGQDTDTHSGKDTDTHSGKDIQTVTTETFSGLDSITAAEYIAGIPNPLKDFAREFRELFYWGL